MRCNPAFPPVPTSFPEVLEIFGDINRYVRNDGTLSPKWEAEKIERIKLPEPIAYAYGTARISLITVHVRLVDVAEMLFDEIWEAELVEALGPYGGGYNDRPNANDKRKRSLHSFGIAWDFNPSGFPNGSRKKRDPRLVAIFEKFGFFPGEKFKGTPDPMHFQYAENT